MTEDEALANRLFLLHIAVLRHEYTDWPDGGDDGELMRGEMPMDPEADDEQKEPVDLGWWIVVGVWLVVGVLIVAVMKKFGSS